MSEHAELRRELSSRLEALRARQGKVDRDLRRPAEKDWQEQATASENDEVLEDLSERSREEIVQLTRAIERIDSGSYGVCDRCGEPIAPGRLRVLPGATACVVCAD